MRSGARRGGTAIVAMSLVATLVTGCGGQQKAGDAAAPVAVTSDLPVLATPTTPAALPTAKPTPSATASPKPRPSRTTTKAAPRPTPSRKPPVEKVLPPPPPPPPPTCTGPKRVGTQVSRAEAKKALTDAAATTYWPNSAPSIKVPLNLVKATAWQESGWQSNIIACDGGVGLMQIMPDTATWMNNRFSREWGHNPSWDIDDYADNAAIGASYLAWSIKYFGDVYFEGDYTVDPADCADHRSPCLLNAVIASYNFGFGAVDTDDGIVIPNPRYVENVRALMTECECLAF